MTSESSTIEIRNAISYQGMLLGGRPTAQDFEKMSEGNYRTVIDLRAFAETGVEDDRKLVEKFGMTAINIEVPGAKGLTKEAAVLLHEALLNAEGPIVVCCASGNRVGALLALRAFWVQGKSVEESMTVGKLAGLLGLESTVRDILESGESVQGVGRDNAIQATPQQSQGADAQQ